MTNPSRRDVVWVTFPDSDDIPDEEMDNPHMAVVLQNNGLNDRKNSTVVIPITSGTASDRTCEVEIPSYEEPVDHDSIAVLTQITTVSIPERIHDAGEEENAWKAGELSRDRMNEIENRLGYVFGI